MGHRDDALLPTVIVNDATRDSYRRSLISYGYRSSPEEILISLEWLERQGYIVRKPVGLKITLEGYNALDDYGRSEQTNSGKVFLVCQFKTVNNEVFQRRFKSTESRTNYPIFRISDHEFAGKIDDEILLQLRGACAVVVDLATANFNVGFEAGYAHALGKPVIYTSQSVVLKPAAIPFDVRVQNIICQSDDESFINRLSNRIKLVANRPSPLLP